MSAKANKTTTSEDTDSVEDGVIVVGSDDVSTFQENGTPESKFKQVKYGSILT